MLREVAIGKPQKLSPSLRGGIDRILRDVARPPGGWGLGGVGMDHGQEDGRQLQRAAHQPLPPMSIESTESHPYPSVMWSDISGEPPALRRIIHCPDHLGAMLHTSDRARTFSTKVFALGKLHCLFSFRLHPELLADLCAFARRLDPGHEDLKLRDGMGLLHRFMDDGCRN